jgi:hypothetical protein
MSTSKQQVARWPWVILLAASMGACSRSDQPGHRTASSPPGARATGDVEATAAPAAPAPSPIDRLLAITDLEPAIAQVKPEMTDTDDEVSPGALMLTIWAAAHLRWSDVAVRRNETSFALVHKDPDAARGKRMCARGMIIQIQKEDLGEAAAFSGLLLSGYSHILSFFAVGSTGELVERSHARFCGVVIGTYDYSNSGGGKGHAVSMVGMFDLRATRKAARGPTSGGGACSVPGRGCWRSAGRASLGAAADGASVLRVCAATTGAPRIEDGAERPLAGPHARSRPHGTRHGTSSSCTPRRNHDRATTTRSAASGGARATVGSERAEAPRRSSRDGPGSRCSRERVLRCRG